MRIYNDRNQNERLPYIEFKLVAVEDRDASIREGRFVAKDIEYCTIIPIGDGANGNLSVEREVDDNIRHRFSAQYEAWKKGLEMPVEGSPLKLWPVISPAQLEMCLRSNIRTVEDLASLPDQFLSKLGLGARSLQNKAKDWLQSSGGQGKLVEEMASLKVALDELKRQNEEKNETINRLLSEISSSKETRPRGRPKLDDAA